MRRRAGWRTVTATPESSRGVVILLISLPSAVDTAITSPLDLSAIYRMASSRGEGKCCRLTFDHAECPFFREGSRITAVNFVVQNLVFGQGSDKKMRAVRRDCHASVDGSGGNLIHHRVY